MLDTMSSGGEGSKSGVESSNSSIYFGGSNWSAGIGVTPSRRGYFCKRTSNSRVDHGKNAPSMLCQNQRKQASSTAPRIAYSMCTDSGEIHTHPSSCCSSPSPLSATSFAPSWRNRLCTFRTAQLNFWYVLSPHPKVVNSVFFSQSPGSFFRSMNFQKPCMLAGISPWPVVAVMKMTMGHEGREESGEREDAERQVVAKW